MKSRVWRRTRNELAAPACGKLAGWQLLSENDYPGCLGDQLVVEHGNQYFDLMHTPGALGVRKTKMMMMVLVELLLLLAAPRLDGDEKRGEGGAPHLGLRSRWHG